MKEYDVVVVGAGPGGLTAGMYSARSELNTVCIEKLMPGGQIANTELVEDYPGFESISGFELAKKMQDHAIKFGLNIITDNISKIKLDGRYRIVEGDNETYKAKAIIVATGGHPRLLGVPGEKEMSGRGVSYCAICDGAFFKGQVIAVVGGGDAAVEEGMYLTKFGSKVYIIHRRDELRAQKIIQNRAFNNDKVEFIWDTVVTKVNGKDKIESKTMPVGALFPFIGFVPNSDIFDFDVKKDESGYIITDPITTQTSVEGVYAIGDVRKQLCKQVTNAVGDGTTAAVAADKYIESWND
jgi:thioredoxin reductase (NADPH)